MPRSRRRRPNKAPGAPDRGKFCRSRWSEGSVGPDGEGIVVHACAIAGRSALPAQEENRRRTYCFKWHGENGRTLTVVLEQALERRAHAHAAAIIDHCGVGKPCPGHVDAY